MKKKILFSALLPFFSVFYLASKGPVAPVAPPSGGVTSLAAALGSSAGTSSSGASTPRAFKPMFSAPAPSSASVAPPVQVQSAPAQPTQTQPVKAAPAVVAPAPASVQPSQEPVFYTPAVSKVSRPGGDLEVKDVDDDGFEDDASAVVEAKPVAKKKSERRDLAAARENITVKVAGKSISMDPDYIGFYSEDMDKFEKLNTKFSDGFERDVYLVDGTMYSLDLQWEYDSNESQWIPVRYRFHENPSGNSLLKVKIGKAFVDVPKPFLIDSTWHKKMQDSWSIIEDEIRVANYDAYTKFIQAAKPKLKAAAKQVISARRSMTPPETTPVAPQPMVINVSVGGTQPGSSQQALATGGQQSFQGSSQQVSSGQGQLQSFGSAVDRTTGAPVQGSGTIPTTTPGGRAMTMQTQSLYSASSSMLQSSAITSGTYFDEVKSNPVYIALYALADETIKGCRTIADDIKNATERFYKKQNYIIQDEKKKTSQYQFAFYNIKKKEILDEVRSIYGQIILLAKGLQKNSNVIFNGLEFFDNSELRKIMDLMTSSIMDLLQSVFRIDDLSANANSISIYTMFARFTQRADQSGGTDADLFDLFSTISEVFQTFLENHGLVLWMLAFGRLENLSGLFRNGTNVSRMPIMTTLERVATTDEGFPGFHGDTVGLYNRIAAQLQSVFMQLKNNYAGSDSKIGLTQIINDILSIIESRDFLSLMLDKGLDEKLSDLDTYKDLKPLAVDSTNFSTVPDSYRLPTVSYTQKGSQDKDSSKQYSSSKGAQSYQTTSQSYGQSQGAKTYQTSGSGSYGTTAYKMPDLVVDVVSGILRELVANKLIYLLGLINTEVFLLFGVSFSKIFGKNSNISLANRTEKLTNFVVIAAGCLNRSFSTNFTISSVNTNKVKTTRHLIFGKDDVSREIYDSWMRVDIDDNKSRMTNVYGATLLDAQIIGYLNDLFYKFRTAVGVGAAAKALFASSSKGKVDPRITSLIEQMKVLEGLFDQETYSKNFKPMSISNGFYSMDFWKISQAVDLRMLKLILLWYNYISWKTPVFTAQPGAQLDDPGLRGAFQNLCKNLLSSTFNEIASKLTYPGVVLTGLNFMLAKISTAPVNNCLFEPKLYAISEGLTSLTEQCGTLL